jgi:hypothetical protein
MPTLKDRQHQIPGGFTFDLPAFGWKSASFSSFDTIVGQVYQILNANPSAARARGMPLERENIANWIDEYNAQRCFDNRWFNFIVGGSNPPPTRKFSEQWPLWARTVGALRKDGEKGVGDTVERLVGANNSESFKLWYKRTFNRNCGCDGRKETWNAKFQYQ